MRRGASGTKQMHFDSAVGVQPAGVPIARAAFSAWLTERHVSDDVVSELAVAFSELLTNAVTAAGAHRDAVTAEAWLDDEDVTIEITNPLGPGAIPVESDLDDPLRPNGRGLMIVRAYTDDIDVDWTDRGVSIRCHRHLS